MKRLKLYFTTDIHGYIYPTDYADTSTKPMGMLHLIQNFKKDGNTLIIDGGDTIQGSPFTMFTSHTSFDVHPIAKVMNVGGYDCITLGNHDFNYGYEYLSKYLNNLDAECTCVNIKDKTDALGIKPYTIKILENGLKVGIMGITTEFVPVWERPSNLTHFEVHPTLSSIAKHFDELKAKSDLVVGIYHGGFEYDVDSHEKLSDTNENLAYAICKQFDFDILLTGHQHLEISDKELFNTHIVQCSHNAKKYVELHAEITDNKHSISSVIKEAQLVASNTPLERELQPLEDKVQTWLDQPVGFLDRPLMPSDHLSMAMNGSYLANFINTVQLEISGADISCTSFANTIKGFNQEVSVRDIVSTYIYPNTLVVLEVSGKILKEAIEFSASYFDYNDGDIRISNSFLQPKVQHYNYDYFSGIDYTIDITKPIGSRVTSILFKGQRVTDDMTLKLVMNNYRATGTGGYDCYTKAPVTKEILTEMPEIITDYFSRTKHVSVDTAKYLHLVQ